MLPKETEERIRKRIQASDHPREQAVDVMYALQRHYGCLSEGAVREAADLLDMTPLEIEELATFYDFIYRTPVGKYVIHVCDGPACWLYGHVSVLEYLSRKLQIPVGGTTRDKMFSLLPVCCIGFCDRAPAMLVNGKPYGPLTPEILDEVLDRLAGQEPSPGQIK